MKLEHCSLAFRDHIVFDDDTFVFADHRLNILVGDNGAGKTSLLNILAGAEVYAADVHAAGLPPAECVAYQMQHPAFLDGIHVEEMLALYRLHAGSAAREYDVLAQRLYGLRHSIVDTLSGGERRLLAVYGAMILDRSLYLFDEPTSELDEHNADLVFSLLTRLAGSGKTVIVATHDLDRIRGLDAWKVAI